MINLDDYEWCIPGDVPDSGALALLLPAAVAVEVPLGVADPLPPCLGHETVSAPWLLLLDS